MIFRQLFEPVSCIYPYLIASRRGGEALIIDLFSTVMGEQSSVNAVLAAKRCVRPRSRPRSHRLGVPAAADDQVQTLCWVPGEATGLRAAMLRNGSFLRRVVLPSAPLLGGLAHSAAARAASRSA
jgi:hypothetical protein